MLDAEQIENWEEENQAALDAATDFWEQIKLGREPERFIPTMRMRLIGKGIGALVQIIHWQQQTIDLLEDEVQDGDTD